MALKDWKKSKQYKNTWFKGTTQKSIVVKDGSESIYGDWNYYVIYDWGNKRVQKKFKDLVVALKYAKLYRRTH